MFCLLAAHGFIITAPAAAQAGTAEIAGTVKDSTDAVLPGVSITLVNQASGQRRQLLTDSDGNYVALLLPVGQYTIRAELAGFNLLVRQGVVLQLGEKVRLDLTLEVGQVTEEVTVEEAAPLLNTSSAEM